MPTPDATGILNENEVTETFKLLTHADLIPMLAMPQNQIETGQEQADSGRPQDGWRR